jgi:hypothetical protein
MEHNYVTKLMRLVADGTIPKGSTNNVAIYHDGWCGTNRGRRCNCDPWFKVRSVTPPKESPGG